MQFFTKLNKILTSRDKTTFISIISIVLLFLIAVQIYIGGNVKNEEIRIRTNLEQESRIEALLINTFIEDRIKILETYASMLDNVTIEGIKEQLSGKAVQLGFRDFLYADIKGNIYYVEEDIVREQRNEAFYKDIITHEVFITEPFYNKETNVSLITISKRIYKDGIFRGVLCGTIDLAQIKGLTDLLKEDSRSGFYILNKDLEPITFKDIQSVSLLKRPNSNVDLVKECLDTKRAKEGYVTMYTKKYLAYCEYLERENWILLNLEPLDSLRLMQTIYIRLLSVYVVCVIIILIYILQLFNRGIKLQEKATTDKLTGCKNRVAFNEMTNAIELGECLVLVYLDLNRFKYVNDTYGHSYGDEILIIFVKVLKEIFGEESVYRLGGDEFIIKKNQLSGLEEKCEQLNERLKEESVHLSINYVIEASYGIGIKTIKYADDIDYVLERADENMYKNKQKRKREQNNG